MTANSEQRRAYQSGNAMSTTAQNRPDSTADAVATTAAAPGADLDRLFARQQARALALRTSTAQERVAKIKRLKQMLFERRDDIQRACYADFRKPAAEVDAIEIL